MFDRWRLPSETPFHGTDLIMFVITVVRIAGWQFTSTIAKT